MGDAFLSQRIDIPLILGYFKHIYSLPMKFFATRKTGDIITRFSDAFVIKDVFSNIVLTLIMDIVMAIITGIILLKMNQLLFGMIVLLVLISVALVFVFKQPYKVINEEQMQQNSTLNSQIIEGLEAIETIKGNANEQMELDIIEKEYIRSLRISFKEGMLSNIQGMASSTIQMIGNILLMYFGIKQVIQDDMTLGTPMAFLTLSELFMGPIERLVVLQLDFQEANISMKRIAEILGYEKEKEEFSEENVMLSEIAFKNVTFRYGNREPVLKNISFDIEKGMKVGIVGASGSGKSTIAKLILKYYECENGKILIDGMNISEINSTIIRQNISYMPQKVELFSRSILDNIRVSKSNADVKTVKAAARLAGADKFIQELPSKYNTILEESGGGLSGGERQRIALARAFLKDNQFYILDESTSNLDFVSENFIFDMIYNKFKEKTMLIVAHRLNTIKNCDKIIVLDKGEIVEQDASKVN